MSRRIITTEITEEDKRIESSLRPQYLDEYIGQEKIKSTLKVLLTQPNRGERLLTMSCFTALRVSARRHSAALLRMRWA